MRPTVYLPHFVPVPSLVSRIGRFAFSGLEVPSQTGPGSVDGLWREMNRRDGGILFLILDVEGKSSQSRMLRSQLELALDHPSTWNLSPGELLVELHSQGSQAWLATNRTFVAQAVLIYPEQDFFLLASAGIPLPHYAPAGEPWSILDVPGTSICLLGCPDLHDEGEPVFPDLRVDHIAGSRFLTTSDGVVEAGQSPCLTGQGVCNLLNGLPARMLPDALLRLVFALAAEFDGGNWARDDATGLSWRLDPP